MNTQSGKAKGRRLQQWVRDQLLETHNVLQPDDVRSTSMGASGEDLLLSPLARSHFPFSVECKNVEKLNVWNAYEQACSNCGDNQPVLIFKKNRKNPLVAIDAEFFIKRMRVINVDGT